MTKKLIIKGADGKYFTDRWDCFWNRDPDSAYHFDNEVEIQSKFETDENKKYGLNNELEDAVFPLEQITILIK